MTGFQVARQGNRTRADEASITETPANKRDNGASFGADVLRGRPLRVCLVKQHTTYDLYTKTGPDLRTIVSSSNWRAGPLGLWEAFECDYRIVYESPDPECQIGKRQWAKYVEGWDIWPEGSVAERAGDVDWGTYDIVICVDVAIPTRIVREHRRTMWCYYFIEGGSSAVDTVYRGSPYFGYNVFFNHRHAKTLLNGSSLAVRKMRREKRAILDFPYYMMSSKTVRNIYGEIADSKRQGLMLSFHSYQAISAAERRSLECLCDINSHGIGVVSVHRNALASEYCVVHPDTRKITGLALVEAVSAGCIALGPRELVVGFPELLCEETDYSDFRGLLRVIERLQNDRELRLRVLQYQSEYVDTCFFRNPKMNLEAVLSVFRNSRASVRRQTWSERRDRVVGAALNLGARARNRALREIRRGGGGG